MSFRSYDEMNYDCYNFNDKFYSIYVVSRTLSEGQQVAFHMSHVNI